MEMPKPTAHHDRLAVFEGTWEGDETLHAAPPMRPAASRARGRFVFRRSLDGFFLLLDYDEFQGGVRTYAGHGVYGYDPKQGTYTGHWFDVMGGFYESPARGRFDGAASDRLVFQLQGPFGHARFTYEALAPDAFAFTIETSQDAAAWTRFMEGRYRRVSA